MFFKKILSEKKRMNETLSGIAKSLSLIEGDLNFLAGGRINFESKLQNVDNGLSAICKNVYAENIRTQEIIDLLEQAFPKEKKG